MSSAALSSAPSAPSKPTDPPYVMRGGKAVVHLALPPGWLGAIDQVRETTPRADWIRSVLLRVLRMRGITGLDQPAPRLTTTRARLKPSRAEAKRRRLRANEQRCRARKKAGAIARERNAAIVFTFTADNTVLASDLDGQYAAIVYSDGTIGVEARHPFERILAELRAAYKRDDPLTDAQVAAVHHYDGWLDSTGKTSLDD